MTTLARGFSDSDRQRITRAIQNAEAQTSAEIVPVIAAASGRYDRPEDIVGFWFALLGIVAVWFLYPRAMPESGSWDTLAPEWELVAMIGVAIVAFVIGAIVATKVGWLRRLCTPRKQMHEEVNARARQVFFDKRVYRTAGASGVLLYVSLFERMAAVIADQSVLDKLGQSQLDETCRLFTEHLRHRNPIDALCEAATSLGPKLGAVLPRAQDDVNELADTLVVLE